MLTFMTVRELYEVTLSADQIEKDQIEYVQLEGWIRTNRNNGSVGFIELNDGTYFKNAQLVYTKDLVNFSLIDKYSTGSAINAIGKYKITPDAKQPFEIEVTQIGRFL